MKSNNIQNNLKKNWKKFFGNPNFVVYKYNPHNWRKVSRVRECPLRLEAKHKLKQTIQETFLCTYNLQRIHSQTIFCHLPCVQKVTLLARAIFSQSLFLVSTWKGSLHNPLYQLLSFLPGFSFCCAY